MLAFVFMELQIVKGKFPGPNICKNDSAILVLGLLLMLAATCASVRAQASTPTAPDAAAATAPDPSETRIAHARALAAAHKLAAAASELDNIRTTATDESVRDVARIMLMNVYLEEGDYARADSLLTDTFKARSPAQESSVQSYFALAGQTVNGARHHIERYREFGINIADKGLPPEAQSDLERLRALLELIATQATEMGRETAKSTDAIALLEEVASVRATVAKDDNDRQLWQQEFTNARQRLAASETRIASISPVLAGRQISTNIPAGASRTSNPGTASSSSTTNTKRAGNASKHVTPANDSGNTASNSSSSTPSSAAPSSSAPASQPGTTSEKKAGGDAGSTAGGQLVDVGSLIDKATQKVNPLYPATARNVRLTGVVTVYLVINENGVVETVQRTSGPQMLRQAAVDAAKRWKFQPTMVDGQPVRVAGYISFNFTL
jgi:TonB family protein